MSAVQNHRQFMVQLQSLQARVDNDIGKTKQYLQVLEQRTLKAETQRMKMQSLLDNDLLAVRNFENRREQRGMDEMGMIQFNQARAA
jgi:flagellar biosynthesis chaperone FliJ